MYTREDHINAIELWLKYDKSAAAVIHELGYPSYGKYEKDKKIKIVLDNHSAHTSKETRKYLDMHPGRFEFIFTPKHGSWLNIIESFFGKFSRVCLKGIRVKTKDELVQRIYQYMDEVNAQPVVYRWKYKMEEMVI